ncbi:MAG: adenylate/guanylate cyclase domain-containing protein, partial [Spirochaetales bacterium]|nr:adenylate/guanylate cyclase domain-containing protein [Spirochaetales bacterium]
IIFIGSIYILYKIRIRKLHKRQQELENLVQLRTSDLLEEKNKSDSLLLNILPVSIAKRLKSGEKAIADRFEDTTVLFADIVNFSELALEVSASQLLLYLNSLFSEFDLLTEEFGIEKIKTIGDAYMAASGIPDVISNHKELMVEFAFKMLDKIELVNRKLGTKMEMRIGIHSGSVVAGVIGKKKFIYDLWGETVNLASRMEQHGKPGKIHVSEEIFHSLSHLYNFEELNEEHIKGAGLSKTYNCLDRKKN